MSIGVICFHFTTFVFERANQKSMNEEIAEYYEELYNLCAVEQEQPLARRYRQLREALERVMRQQMMGTGLQATDLAARINYVATQFALDGREQNQLHTFRLTSNDILNHRKEPSEQEFCGTSALWLMPIGRFFMRISHRNFIRCFPSRKRLLR